MASSLAESLKAMWKTMSMQKEKNSEMKESI